MILRHTGVRGRLILAFLGITGFAVIAAVAALFAFSSVGRVFDRVTRERMPAAFAALELSKQVERVAAAAPTLLASGSENQKQEAAAQVSAEIAKLEQLFADVKARHPDPGSLSDIDRSVAGIRRTLSQLETLVSKRLNVASRRYDLANRVVQANVNTSQAGVDFSLPRFQLNLNTLRTAMQDPSLSDSARAKAATDLARDVQYMLPMEDALRAISSVRTTLIQVNTASSSQLPHLAFNVASWTDYLDNLANDVDPDIKNDVVRQIAELRQLAVGPGSIPDLRSQELSLIDDGEELIEANSQTSAALTATVSRLIQRTRADIEQAESDVASTQRHGTYILAAVVLLSLLSSSLIIWRYVGNNLIRRLTELSKSMMAIAGGELRAPLPASGSDEIGRMADALRVFRDTAVEIEEQNLRERQVVLDTIDYGVLILDADLRVKMHNRAFREMWNVAPETLSGGPLWSDVLRAFENRGLHSVNAAEWGSYVEKRSAEVTAGASPPQEWERPDGRVIQYEIAELPDGGRLLTYFDLTHLKKVETELRARTDELEIASRHKSQFLANMSHELRTPLNAILGFTELILDNIYGELPERARGALSRVQANGKHLLGLINDVLDLSKIEAGQLTLQLASYSMKDVVDSVFSALEPLANEKKLALRMELPGGLPIGRGDERRLAQVLMNLVGNAIKFTEAGEVAIHATASNGSFRVEVSDTGPGIESADREKIFGEFQQADSSATRKKGGTGLGLSISRRIVEMHGGRLSVESEPGRGSMFFFTVPVAVAPQAGLA